MNTPVYVVYAPQAVYEETQPWITVASQEEADRLVDAINSAHREGVYAARWEKTQTFPLPPHFEWEVEFYQDFMENDQWSVFIRADEQMADGEVEVTSYNDFIHLSMSFTVGAKTAKEAVELAQKAKEAHESTPA